MRAASRRPFKRPTSAAASRERARSNRWKSTTTRSRMPSRRPLPRTRWLRQSTAAGSTSPTSTASLSRISASGRICTKPNSRGRPGGTARLTANSISTGVPIPRSPSSMSVDNNSARGKRPCLRTGAKVTSRGPGRESPSYTASFSGEYVDPTAARAPSSSATASPNDSSRIPPSAVPPSSGSAQNSRCVVSSTSSTEENWRMCCG